MVLCKECNVVFWFSSVQACHTLELEDYCSAHPCAVAFIVSVFKRFIFLFRIKVKKCDKIRGPFAKIFFKSPTLYCAGGIIVLSVSNEFGYLMSFSLGSQCHGPAEQRLAQPWTNPPIFLNVNIKLCQTIDHTHNLSQCCSWPCLFLYDGSLSTFWWLFPAE